MRCSAGRGLLEEIAGPDGLLGQLTRRLLNRALEVELSEHLGYEPGSGAAGGVGNARTCPRATYARPCCAQDYVAQTGDRGRGQRRCVGRAVAG